MSEPWRRKVVLGDGRVTLYEGDCLEVLPHLEGVDAVVTDPPYSSGGAFRGDRVNGGSSQKYGSIFRQDTQDFQGDSRDQRSFLAWCAIWLSMARRASASGAVCLIFCDWRQLPITTDAMQCGGWVWRGLVPWDKTSACRPQKGRFAAQCEYVAWGSAGPLPTQRGVGCLPGLVSAVNDRNRTHIAQKPLSIMRELLEIAPPGALIVDPFMGSGTTGVAAVQLGRRFVGIELEPRYFDIAAERITHALAQPRLFEDEPQPQQEALL